jgi:hypothetical protein
MCMNCCARQGARDIRPRTNTFRPMLAGYSVILWRDRQSNRGKNRSPEPSVAVPSHFGVDQSDSVPLGCVNVDLRGGVHPLDRCSHAQHSFHSDTPPSIPAPLASVSPAYLPLAFSCPPCAPSCFRATPFASPFLRANGGMYCSEFQNRAIAS